MNVLYLGKKNNAYTNYFEQFSFCNMLFSLQVLILFIIMQDIHEGLNFSAADDESYFGILSIKFSKDGRELVVGNSNESICIYDL